jgi:thiol-disulfide isomerase/thioredoxin
MNKVKIFIIVIGVLVVGTIGMAVMRGPAVPEGPGKYDEFAVCLKDKGAVFYGAFWCPHCQAQKKLFGSSARLLPYVECSMPDNSQTQQCIDKKIESYPTWEFADGTRPFRGEVTLEQLSEKTGCPLPSDAESPEAVEEGGASVPPTIDDLRPVDAE